MANVLLNGDVTGVTYAANTWGELLAMLDEQCSASGDVVTGVRLDELEVAAFREPEAMAQPLPAGTEVFVETARPADLILQTLDEADAGAQAIVDAGIALAGLYRAPDVSAANHALPAFAENLGSLMMVTDAVARGTDVDLSGIYEGDLSALQMINNLIACTDVLITAQLAGDWTKVAHVIDFDIVQTVQRWPHVLQAIREAAPMLRDVA